MRTLNYTYFPTYVSVLFGDGGNPDISRRFDFGPLRAELTVMVRVGAL